MTRRQALWTALAGMALLVVAPVAVPSWALFILTLALAKFMVVLGVALLLRGGLISFGHALFYAIGAYTVGFAVKWFGFREVVVLLPIGGLLGAVAAALVGLVLVRFREVFFAMLYLAFTMILFGALVKLYWLTGGTDGLSVGMPTFFGVVPPHSIFRTVYYYFALLVVGVVIYVVHRFVGSPLGYYLRALLDNEIRIEYSGASVRRVIFYTNVLTGVLGGLSGVLAAFTVGHVTPDYAHWLLSGEILFIALLGGFASVPGPLMGAIAFEFIRTYASKYAPEAWQMILGSIMLIIILFWPGGLWAIYESVIGRFGKRGRELAGG